MNYYIDIQVKPNIEMKLNVLMNAVYGKLHKCLYDLRSTDIGISFPNYNVCLGNLLRLHGIAERLHGLQSGRWLDDMICYCSLSSVNHIPTQTKYRTISRKQTNLSQSKLRRLLKRGSASEELIRQYRAKMFSEGCDNPYLELFSISNGHRYRRYIQFGALQERPVSGQFDSFGLSGTATIPWF